MSAGLRTLLCLIQHESFLFFQLTTADLAVYDITETILKKNPIALDKFPEIQKMRKAVEANAKVKAYLSTRKATDW